MIYIWKWPDNESILVQQVSLYLYDDDSTEM